jgi:hypothetical protein
VVCLSGGPATSQQVADDTCGESGYSPDLVVIPRNNSALTTDVLADARLTKVRCDVNGETCTYRFPPSCGDPASVAAKLSGNIYWCRDAGVTPQDPVPDRLTIGKVFPNAALRAITTRTSSGKLKYRPGEDALFSDQHALRALGAEAAWQYADPSSGATIFTAIIDSGVALDHPDLASQVERGVDIPCRTLECNGGEPLDSHGTSMAGIVAAARYNIGMIGTAWNTRVMPIKVSGADIAAYEDAVVQAIQYAAQQDARVLNFSLGGNTPTALIADALETSQDNFLFVTAAGNQCLRLEDNPIYPAVYPIDRMLVVMSHDDKGARVESSGWGLNVDIAAPGDSLAAVPCDPANLASCYELGGSDTSNAAAYVSGAAALLWSANPDWHWSEIRWRILETADHEDRLRGQMEYPRRLNLARMMYPVSFTHARANKVSKTWADVGAIDTSKAFPKTMCASIKPMLVRGSDPAGAALDRHNLQVGDEIRVRVNCTRKTGSTTTAYSPLYSVD